MKQALQQIPKRMFSQKNSISESFINVSMNNPFPIQNLPIGVFQNGENQRSVGVAIGDNVIDVSNLVRNKVFGDLIPQHVQETLVQPTLNQFFSLKRSERAQVREALQQVLAKDSSYESQVVNTKSILDKSEVDMVMPVRVGDYTDFYASRNHAENVGEMFRGPDNKLMPNWLHMPIAYHGRASSVNTNKTVIRPKGQTELGQFAEEKRFDIELEMAMIIGGQANQNQSNIPIEQAYEHIGGFTLMNDWSARTIQKNEYVPLGPFLGKNFSTTISPWIIFPEAIEQFRYTIDNQDGILPYLQSNDLNLYDIPLEVLLKPNNGSDYHLISESNMKNLHWTFEQMIAHHTITGCDLNSGDVVASGTISGSDKGTQTGSMLELSWGGKNPIQVGDQTRTFLEDGDSVLLRGGRRLPSGQLVGFGEVETTVLPAHK